MIEEHNADTKEMQREQDLLFMLSRTSSRSLGRARRMLRDCSSMADSFAAAFWPPPCPFSIASIVQKQTK